MRKITVFLGMSMGLMLLALLVGILRLMSLNKLGSGLLSPIYPIHSVLMVFGFMASIIMTERIVGLAAFPNAKDLKAATVMVPSILVGVAALAAGHLFGLTVLRYLGAILLQIACLAFLLVLRFLKRKSDATLASNFMMLSVVSLLAAAFLSGLGLPPYNTRFVMLMLSFPVLFILDERVELTRIGATAATTARFRLAFALAALSVAARCLRFVLIAESQSFQRLAKSSRPLQRCVSVHVRAAYSWGLVGVILVLAYALSQYRLNLYDAFIHSLMVGFVGTMLLAHGPVILPGLAGFKIDERKLSLIPLTVLSLSVLLRVVGELSLLAYGWEPIRIVVGLSGWLVLAAVLIFVWTLAV